MRTCKTCCTLIVVIPPLELKKAGATQILLTAVTCPMLICHRFPTLLLHAKGVITAEKGQMKERRRRHQCPPRASLDAREATLDQEDTDVEVSKLCESCFTMLVAVLLTEDKHGKARVRYMEICRLSIYRRSLTRRVRTMEATTAAKGPMKVIRL